MGLRRKAIVSVVSDLVTDQRVHRTALTLHEMGFSVTLVGRKQPDSLEVMERPYAFKRFRLPFHKGPLFYAVYNIRLFFYLLFRPASVYVSNDLDTLPANFLAAKLNGSKIVYDSHEYFTGVPELAGRPRIQAVWKWIERMLLPKVRHCITVNESIARLYQEEYKKKFEVIRNVPIKRAQPIESLRRSTYGLPEGKPVFLFQGAGINIDRGGEEAIDAIAGMSDAVLLFIGGGDVTDVLKSKVREKRLETKVFFIPKQPMQQLAAFTRLADFGLSLDKSTNINYRFSLPNKLFDYIHAGLPVLVTDLPEVERIVRQYDIGMVVPSAEPHLLSEAMEQMIRHPKLAAWKENLNIAAAELCWDREKLKLISLINNVVD